MSESFLAALRAEFRPRLVAMAVVLLAVLVGTTSATVQEAAYIAALGVLAGVLSAASEAELFDRRLVELSSGALAVLGGVGVLAVGLWGVPGRAVGALAVLAGAWLALDGAVALAVGAGEPAEATAGDAAEAADEKGLVALRRRVRRRLTRPVRLLARR